MSISYHDAPEPIGYGEKVAAFREVVETVGSNTIDSIIAAGESARTEGYRGALDDNVDEGLVLESDGETISFSFRGWGPYVLTKVEIDRILAETDS